MARTPVARTAVPVASLNLTDLAFATLTLGANNGAEIPYAAGDLLVLNNTTGGNAVYTIKTAQPAAYVAQSLTVPDKTIAVATAKMHVLRLDPIWRQADNDIYIDCDVAAKLAMLAMT